MALGGLLGGLANLGAVSQGADQAQYRDTLQQLAMQQLKQRKTEALLAQQQQQALGGIGNLISSGRLNQLGGGGGDGLMPPGSSQPTPGQPPQMDGGIAAPPQVPSFGGAMGQPQPGMTPYDQAVIASGQTPTGMPGGLQGGTFGGNMSSGLQMPGQAVKGSWFGNSPGWFDPSDSGVQAGGQSVANAPGIALPSRAGLGQLHDVTTPDGRTFEFPQTDVGPAKWTGRGVDINSSAAKVMGYSPGNFPTDQVFKVALASTDPQTQALAHVASQQTVRQIPGIGQTVGRWDMDGLAKLIDQTNPGMPPAVKAAIFLKMAPLLSQQAKEQAAQVFEQYKFGVQESDKQQDFGIRQQEIHQQHEDTAAYRAATLANTQNKGWQILQQPDGTAVRVNPNTGEAQPLSGLQAGANKMGSKPAGGAVSDMQAEWVANYIQATGTWPVGSGRNQALQNKVEQILAKKGVDPQTIAQASGAFKADSSSLAAATKLADATSSYEQTTLKNLDLATEQIHKAAPTGFGPFINKWLETGETFAGDTTVPKSVSAVITLANEYAKVMSGSTGAQAATDSSRREAAEILNPYFASGQWDEVAGLIKREMNNRITSLHDNVDIIQSRMGRGGGAAGKPATAAGGSPAAGPASGGISGGGIPPVTEEQYNALPSGSVYTIPGDPTPRYKP